MSRLFVIGNGFDLAHGFPTSYEDFKEYLCDMYMPAGWTDSFIPVTPTVSIGYNGDEVYSEKEVADFLVYLISAAEPKGDRWSDLEASLGRLDYSQAFDELPRIFDEEGDIDYWKEMQNNEDMGSNLYDVILHIKDFFYEWVNDIDIIKKEEKLGFRNLIGTEDVFLTFNYTETLEKLYGVAERQICHIHGKQGEDILFGHGNAEDRTDDYMRRHVGAETALAALDEALRKETEKALNANIAFLNRIDSRVKEVYSIGFSFADVDLIYINEICRRLPADAEWNLEDYGKEDIPKYEKKLRKCGFKGTIKTFSL